MRRAAIGLFILGAILFLAPAPAHSRNYFNPCASVELTSITPYTPSDIKTTYASVSIPPSVGRFGSPQDRPGEWMTSVRVDFTPPGWYVARDVDIPNGTKVGEYKSQITLGLVNNGCNLVLNNNFALLDATIDRNNPIEIDPFSPDRLNPLSVTSASGVPAGAEQWPAFLTNYASRTGMDLGRLRARIFGVNTTDVTGTTVVWNLLVFEPGAIVGNGIYTDPALGYPTLAIYQDPTSPGHKSDPVSDFCSPYWSEQTIFGRADGIPFRSNSDDGEFNFITFAQPAPDADDDGIENALDPCPYEANNAGWDPRAPLIKNQTPGDPDIDGLPSDCDPQPDEYWYCSAGGYSPPDQDCDQWITRGDNCPLLRNSDQEDADLDAIGDACDRNLNTRPPFLIDGPHIGLCVISSVTLGTGGSPPPDPHSYQPCGDIQCSCVLVFDLDCDLDADAIDLFLQISLFYGETSVPCPQGIYRGCDNSLNYADITAFLRYLIHHTIPDCGITRPTQ